MRKFTIDDADRKLAETWANNKFFPNECALFGKNFLTIHNIQVVELEPAIRVIRYKNGRLVDYYLSFPYLQFYQYKISYTTKDEIRQFVSLTSSVQPVIESTTVCRSLLPNIIDVKFLGQYVCLGSEPTVIEQAINIFWNTTFNRWYSPSWGYSPFKKWGKTFSLRNWHELTEKHGAFAVDADWPKLTYTFGQMTRGK